MTIAAQQFPAAGSAGSSGPSGSSGLSGPSGPVSYEIAWAQTFQTAMTALPATHQAAVLETIGKLQKGHGSTHLHALSPMKWVSFCVSKDAVRIICDREGSTLVL